MYLPSALPYHQHHKPQPQFSVLSDFTSEAADWVAHMLHRYPPAETHLMEQAVARDPSCIQILLSNAALIEQVDRSVFFKHFQPLLTSVIELGILAKSDSAAHLVAAAVAETEPAVLDALVHWVVTKPSIGLSTGGVSPDAQPAMPEPAAVAIITIVFVATRCSPHAAAAIAQRPKLVRTLVTAVDRFPAQDRKEFFWSQTIPTLSVLLLNAPGDVVSAIRGQQGGAKEDSEDLEGKLQEQVAAAVAARMQGRGAVSAGKAILAALDAAQQQQQQQPPDSPGCVCAGCGKRAASEGVAKLRRCGGCPRATALRFCGAECELSLLWVWVFKLRRGWMF